MAANSRNPVSLQVFSSHFASCHDENLTAKPAQFREKSPQNIINLSKFKQLITKLNPLKHHSVTSGDRQMFEPRFQVVRDDLHVSGNEAQ